MITKKDKSDEVYNDSNKRAVHEAIHRAPPLRTNHADNSSEWENNNEVNRSRIADYNRRNKKSQVDFDIEKAGKDYKINARAIEQHSHSGGGHTVVTEGKGKKKKIHSTSLYDPYEEKMHVGYGTKGSKEISITSENDLKNASLRVAIDELLNKAKSYPKVESYLRNLDKRRIDNDEDVPVTKRETAVRTADENAAKKLESQGKSMDKSWKEDSSRDHKIEEDEWNEKHPKIPASRPGAGGAADPGPMPSWPYRSKHKTEKSEESDLEKSGSTHPKVREAMVKRETHKEAESLRDQAARAIRQAEIAAESKKRAEMGKSKDDSDAASHYADVEEHRRKTEPKSTWSEDDEADYSKPKPATKKSLITSIDALLEKCNSHVLTEGKAEKKQPEKKNGHVFGNTPLQTENKEMVKVPVEGAWKSSLVKSIDLLLKEVSAKRMGYTFIDKRHHADESTDYEKDSQQHLTPEQKHQSSGRAGGIKARESKKEKTKYYSETTAPKNHSDYEKDAQEHLTPKQKHQSYSRTGGIKARESKREKEKAKYYSSTTAPKNPHTDEGKRIISEYKESKKKKMNEGLKKRAEREANPPVNSKNTWFGLSVDEESNNLIKSIDALMEKAMFGPGTRKGKIHVQGTHKNPKHHGKVSTPQLSEARKKEIIEGSRKKALTQAEMGGLHGQAAKIRAEKSEDSHNFQPSNEDMDDLKELESHFGIDEGGKLKGDRISHNKHLSNIRIKKMYEEADAADAKKSIDERTVDLVKALNVDYGPRKSGYRRGGSSQDPDAGIEREKERKMDADEKKSQVGTKNSAIKDGGRRWTAEDKTQKSLDSDLNKDLREGYKKESIKQTGEDYDHKAEADYKQSKAIRDKNPGITAAEPGREEAYKKEASLREKLAPKSLDERTADLHKGFSGKTTGHAVGRGYVSNNPKKHEQSKRVAEKFHFKNKDEKQRDDFNEGLTEEVWQHNLKLAKKSMQDVVNTWQTDSPYITKGAKVMPVGPGGEVQDLSKDEDDDNGAE
jgi:hypothetical protein